MSDFRRYHIASERQRFDAMLSNALAKLSAEVDAAAAALDRPGGRAIRRRLVKEMRRAIGAHRIALHVQAELDEAPDIDRGPAEVVAFPTARIVSLRPMGEPADRAAPKRRRERLAVVGGTDVAASTLSA